MQVRRSGRNVRIKFDAPWESKVYLAQQNAMWFNDKAAKRLYREAIKMAPDDQKDAIRAMLKRDCGVTR